MAVSLPAAAPASAATVMERPLIKAFDGSDTTAGKFQRARYLAVDQTSGAVYVTDEGKEPIGPIIDKFNAAGEAQNFPATGESTLPLEVEGAGLTSWPIAVDNSGANSGFFYVLALSTVKAFNSAGTSPWAISEDVGGFGDCIAVDAEGHPWTSILEANLLREYASTGSPPLKIDEIPETSGCPFALDHSGNFYIGQGNSVAKYVGGSFNSTLDPYQARGMAVDQSNAGGHIFVAHAGVFFEYDASGNLVGMFGEDDFLPSGFVGGIAYNATSDSIYVAERERVLVFGPPKIVGTAPDLTINPTTSNSIHMAHVGGTINPLGLENSYHFEYKSNGQAAWTSGVTSTPTEHIAPPDSTTHSVSEDLSGLEPFTQYEVRLVATNDETGVENTSKVDRFRTGQFAVLTINDPTEVTTHTAKISGTVDPKDTETTWRFQTSSNPECMAGKGFSDHPSHTIEANAGSTPVEETLTGLVAAQGYCVRIAASNSPGTATSEIKQLTTLAAPPLVEGRGAAPRTQAGARLNAFVDPENAATTYRFEYSEDGGASWIARPDHLLEAGKTTSVLVSEELSALEPGTPYSFRIFAENAGGTAQGEAQAFATLAEPPQACPNEDVRVNRHTSHLGVCRGIELVNEPDKGNQNVFSEAPPIGASQLSEDGNKVLWRVAGGAPGGPSGAFSVFLARRTGEGWRSQSVIPPAEEQFGGGALTYELNGVTPDLGSFIFGVRTSTGLDRPPAPTLVRISEGAQDVLKTYSSQPFNLTWEQTLDLSDDGVHVLFIDAQTGQLEDIGAARVGPPVVPGETVSILPDKKQSECGLDAFGGTSFGNFTQPGYQPGYHWIGTADASRVYFLAKPNVDEAGGGNCESPSWRLYVRNREAGKTTLIDSGQATFLRATPDGRHAYFATESKLDPADTNSGDDVYRWDEETGQSNCLTCLPETAAANLEVDGSESRGILVSDDFSHVYFLSKNRLVPGLGKQGKLNLYSLSGGQVRFVATVTKNVLGGAGTEEGPSLSAHGDVLLFRAEAGLGMTTDAITPKCAASRFEGIGPCEELYRYDDRDRSLECLSCDHEGVTSHSFGSPYLGPRFDFRLSGDGSTVAFATAEALLPTDVNNGTDIYEWRNGALNLITDGVSAFQEGASAPRVVGLDSDGSDLLFALVPPGGSLTGFERDGVANLYDARIDGGFEPPPPKEECEGDSCQGPLVAAPPAAQPASASYHGPGNPGRRPKPRCRRGSVRRHGRCVKHHPRKHGRHQKRAGNAKQGRRR